MSKLLRTAAQHVFELFRSAKTDNPLVYHGFKRTRELVANCKEIAKGSKLDQADVDVLLLAAWFRDAGYASGIDGDRAKSITIMREFLEQNGQPAELCEAVTACISGSAAAPHLANGIERDNILRDALLVPLAGKNYIEEAELLRLEIERRKGKLFSDVEWTQKCISFFDAHLYNTRYAQLEYNGGRGANLVRLHKLLRNQVEDSAEERAEQAKISKGVGKTVESIFYYLTKIQVALVNLADRRTSTMVHVNAIMMSIVVGLLLRRIDSSMNLLIPTLILLTVNLVVIFISIVSMRSARSTLSSEEARTHDKNLLAFTNDNSVSLEEYAERMNRLVPDVPALRKTMIEHMYFVRKMLIARQRALRITYDVFIGGLAVSLLAFAIALIKGRGP